MKKYTDQLDRSVSISRNPQRIVSVVPSQTELLFALGLDDRIVGRTRYCVEPAGKVEKVAVVGGTKKLRMQAIQSLQPDLILANKEENTKEDIQALAELFPVWVSDVRDLSGALKMVDAVGKITGKTKESSSLVEQIRKKKESYKMLPGMRAVYLIWQNPWMVAGGDTFIQAMLREAGFENIFGRQQRYPQVTLEDIAAKKPDVVLLSSEPFPFAETHARQISGRLPESRVLCVDGRVFSWYGSSLEKAFDYFESLKPKLR